MWNKLRDASFKFFGKSLESFEKYFESVRSDLPKSDIGLSLIEYVYVTFFVMLIVFIIEFPLLVLISALTFQKALISLIFSLTISIFIELGLFLMFYTYPSIIAKSRKKNIDAALPFATTYMATIASSGAPPVTMFKLLAKFKEYGEISKEAEKITRDVEAFGMDILNSIKRAADKTPSSQLRELLWGLDTVIRAGGNLSDFLHEKSKMFMAEHRRKLKSYSETLSLMIEMYLTVVVVGSIFFIIMSALMSMFGAGELSLLLSFLQFVVIFIGLPAASIIFIVILKSISPGV